MKSVSSLDCIIEISEKINIQNPSDEIRINCTNDENSPIIDIKIEKSKIKGIKVCRQAKASWKEEFDKRTNPFGQEYYWLTGKFINNDKGEDTDEWALKKNYISVVPVEFDLTAHHAIQELNEWNFK